MTTPSEHSDDHLKPLFAATASDAAPPDRAVLAALRERSTEEFALHSRDQWSRSGSAGASPSQRPPATMFPLHVLMALAATAAVVMAGFFFSRLQRPTPKPVAPLTFGDEVQIGQVRLRLERARR